MAYLTLELQIYFSKTTAEERKKKKQKFDTNGRFTLKILVCFRQNNNFPAKDAGDQNSEKRLGETGRAEDFKMADGMTQR